MAVGDTAALLRSIRRHTHIPSTHPSYSDAFVLEDATEELHSYLLPLGLVERQELWAGPVGRVTLPVEEGVASYVIPPRAVGGKVRSARLLDRDRRPTYLSYYGREEVAQAYVSDGLPSGLVLEGNTVRLHPVPRGLVGYVLELEFYVRPAALVPVGEAAPITLYELGDGAVIVQAQSTADNAFVFGVGALDVVSCTPPFDVKALEAVVISSIPIGGGLFQLLLDGDFPSLQVGDYLCLPGTAPVVQAPLEWHPLLALKVANRHLSSLGDLQAAEAKGREGAQKQSQAATLIRPRREDVQRKPRNGMDKWKVGSGGWGY